MRARGYWKQDIEIYVLYRADIGLYLTTQLCYRTIEKASFSELSKLEVVPGKLGFSLPAVGDEVITNWSDTAASTDIGAKVVPALPLTDGVSVSKCGVFTADCTVLVTAAVIVVVKASTSTLTLVFAAVSSSNGVAVDGRLPEDNF